MIVTTPIILNSFLTLLFGEVIPEEVIFLRKLGEVKGSERSLSFAWKLKDECIGGIFTTWWLGAA